MSKEFSSKNLCDFRLGSYAEIEGQQIADGNEKILFKIDRFGRKSQALKLYQPVVDFTGEPRDRSGLATHEFQSYHLLRQVLHQIGEQEMYQCPMS